MTKSLRVLLGLSRVSVTEDWKVFARRTWRFLPIPELT
jgi:hypothetical protein